MPAGQPAAGPRLTQNEDGTVNLSWMERQEDGASLHYATYRKEGWTSATEVVSDPQMFVNWADLPGVVATGPASAIAYWLSHTSGGTYSYQVLTSRTDDAGTSWSTPKAHMTTAHTPSMALSQPTLLRMAPD